MCSGSMTEKVYKYVIVGGGVSAVSFTSSPPPFPSFLPSFLFFRHLVHPNLDCCNLSSPSVCYTNLDRVEELGQFILFYFLLPILMTFSNLIDRDFSPKKRHLNEFSLKIVVQAFFSSDFMYIFVRFISC